MVVRGLHLLAGYLIVAELLFSGMCGHTPRITFPGCPAPADTVAHGGISMGRFVFVLCPKTVCCGQAASLDNVVRDRGPDH